MLGPVEHKRLRMKKKKHCGGGACILLHEPLLRINYLADWMENQAKARIIGHLFQRPIVVKQLSL